MVTPQLTEYIASESNKSVAPETIRTHLLSNGWSDSDISQAFATAFPPSAHASKYPSPKLVTLLVLTAIVSVVVIIFLFIRGKGKTNPPVSPGNQAVESSISSPSPTPQNTLQRSARFPEYVPNGFSPAGDLQLQLISNKEYLILEYRKPTGESFVFSQYVDPAFTCQKPTAKSDSYSDYSTFTLTNGLEACALTFGLTSTEERVYNWVEGDTRFTLKAVSLSVDDSQFLQIADSLSAPKTTNVIHVPVPIP